MLHAPHEHVVIPGHARLIIASYLSLPCVALVSGSELYYAHEE